MFFGSTEFGLSYWGGSYWGVGGGSSSFFCDPRRASLVPVDNDPFGVSPRAASVAK